MVIDRMQTQRWELKYLVNEETALRLRDFIKSYLDMDEYCVTQPSSAYPVHSLYLDSKNLITYWETINGNKNRFKLRLRYYNTDPSTPVFFEIKRRVNNCILKQRGGVKQSAVPHLLSGHLPESEHFIRDTPKARSAVNKFCELMHRIQAEPRVHIAYDREAYANEEGTVRVTMDRNVRAEGNTHFSIKTEMAKPRFSFKPYVILELKFTNRYPNWFKELVQIFHIMQRGAAKYVMSVQAVGHRKVGAVTRVVREEEVLIDGETD